VDHEQDGREGRSVASEEDFEDDFDEESSMESEG